MILEKDLLNPNERDELFKNTLKGFLRRDKTGGILSRRKTFSPLKDQVQMGRLL